MKERLRKFLDLRGDRQAGRWFGALLAVGLLVLGYAIITDWPVSSVGERIKRIVTVLMAGWLAIFYLKQPARAPSMRDDEPPA